MDQLVLDRGYEKGKLTRIQTFYSKLTQPLIQQLGLGEFEGRLEQLEQCKIGFDQIQRQIDELCTTEDDISKQEQEKDEFESKYFTMKSKLKITIKALTPSREGGIIQNVNSISTSSTPAQVQLPRLNLPLFHGSYQEWQSFKDLFTALVDSNSSLAASQKLQYLKSCLKGEASHLLSNITVTDSNYAEAWEILKNRFDNTRLIIFSHLNAFFEQPKINKESAAAFRNLLDTTTENLRALKALGEPTDQWNSVVVYSITEKLDTNTRKQWEYTTESKEVPTFAQLQKFLESRCQALEAVNTSKSSSQSLDNQQKKTSKERAEKSASAYHSASNKCGVCEQDHIVPFCPVFKSASLEDRSTLAKKHSLCFNCLRAGHSVQQCRGGSCKKCDKKHNTMLHYTPKQKPEDISTPAAAPKSSSSKKASSDSNNTTSESSSITVTHTTKASSQSILLATAIVQVQSSNGYFHACRALIDSGSEASFVTEWTVKKLGLKRHFNSVSVNTLGSSQPGKAKGFTQLSFYPRNSTSKAFHIEPLILENLTVKLPRQRVDVQQWKNLHSELFLADPHFDIPGHIDILLGQDIISELLQVEIPNISLGLTAQNTHLGWIISGKVQHEPRSNQRQVFAHHTTINDALQDSLNKFWNIEEMKPASMFTKEEQRCEEHYISNTKRLPSGQYQVSLPFKDKTPEFGNSCKSAISRLKYMERKLQNDPWKRTEYNKFMQEYSTLNHMALIPEEELSQPNYYLPHHCVIKDSSTTKLRVVFDGSAKAASGRSLNESILVGPTIQDDLISILLRFRIHRVAFTADVMKMYRYIAMKPEDCQYQRIVWREDLSKPIQHFKLLTVTYGTASAPFLAIRTLLQLAKDGKANFPQASEVLSRDFYVDDLISGADSSTSAILIQQQLMDLLNSACLKLRKWTSNDPALLELLEPSLREIPLPLDANQAISVKALGIQWNPAMDTFTFANTISGNAGNSKRSILSQIAQFFDPMGLMSPVTVMAKIFMQELWKVNLQWDDPLPEHLFQKWMDFKQELSCLQQIQIPRAVVPQDPVTSFALHGFCDASEKAYAATVYIQCVDRNGESKITLLASKTKVAPLKQISVPRLELCGALLLARLITMVKQALQSIVKIQHINTWTDSTIVLAWLNSEPTRWKTFVANRVSEINSLLPNAEWNHVTSEHNPADCASRGIKPSELKDHPLWWSGPTFLEATPKCKPMVCTADNSSEVLQEQRNTQAVNVHIAQPSPVYDDDLLKRYSSHKKLFRITAYLFRFIKNMKQTSLERNRNALQLEEVNEARTFWIKAVQQEAFFLEIKALGLGKFIPSSSNILRLAPKLDQNGILRVGGRLSHASISEDQKFPIILPAKHHLSKLIVETNHREHLHAPCQALMAITRQEFWIPSLRQLVRDHIHRCVTCCRNKPILANQHMADLPTSRVTPANPFNITGVDFAGPITVKVHTLRNAKHIKCYIALFICFVTKAIHLEVVEDLTSQAFIAAFDRFIGRRGCCQTLHSDQGSNFTGANRQLQAEFNKVIQQDEKFQSYAVNKGIKWKFNVPAAPHHGGLWEAGVKSAKHHLRRVMGTTVLTLGEFNTLLIQVEAILNSRPLCRISNDPKDLEPLTPAHFLIGSALTNRPEIQLVGCVSNRLTRWQHVQQMKQNFWNRWKNEYLSELQERNKWTQSRNNIQIGDIVIVKEEDHVPPLKWPIARVTDVHPGKDGKVRIVTIRSAAGIFQRPIVKLCLLPVT